MTSTHARADGADAPRWTAMAGAWLGIGAAPGAMLVGASLAQRHDGPVPIWSLVAGGVLMATLLAGQGRLGLAPPHGEGQHLSGLSPGYLQPAGRQALNVLLAAAMTGWLGFNLGLGGAALASLLRVPDVVGAVLLGVPILLLARGGIGRWNLIAAIATASALALVAVVLGSLAAPGVPLTARGGLSGSLQDAAALVGYAAVFTVRAPDFSAGLARRRDLAMCVGLLVAAALMVATAGMALYLGSGTADVVGALAAPGGMAAGNLLVALAFVAPSLSAMHSGALAFAGSQRLTPGRAQLLIGGAGLLLAVFRFDRLLVGFVGVLAAALPPLIVPMALEGRRRRRGHPPRQLPVWTWLPGSVVGVTLTATGEPAAAAAGLAVALLTTLVWAAGRRLRQRA